MAANILNIGKSALTAAQIGISTTGQNIANASTAGYSRQVVIQSAANAQNFGYGFLGQGTAVTSIERVYDDLLAKQMVSSQSSTASVNAYSTQMSNIDNMLSNATAGLSPALQGFFGSVQSLSTKPGDTASRQSLLSSAQTLASRFQSLNGSLNQIQDGVTAQISSDVTEVNTYAKQIAQLNGVIEKALATNNGNPPNDLMDQRDQLVNQLSSKIKTTIVQQGTGTYNVFVGNGLPLVVGKDTFSLVTAQSLTDPGRLEVGYDNKNQTTILGTESLTGGSIGGLLEFRKNSLDGIQNQLGQIAVTLAGTFNSQLAQGLDSNGNPGTALFGIPDPIVTGSSLNTGNAVISSKIVDAKAVTSSDYRVQYDGTNYKVTRLNDNQVQSYTSLPQTLDGISITAGSGTIAAGDEYLIRPTATAASGMTVLIKDVAKLAVGGPALTSTAASSNTGTGAISTPVASSAYAGSPLSAAFTLSYASGTNLLSGFPASQPVTVTSGSTSTTYAAGASVPYTAGATITVGNLSFSLSGAPANGDQYTVSPNSTVAAGDNRNGLLLAALQSAKTVNNGTTTYADAFGQLVSAVGNKTNELQISAKAETALLAQTTTAMQSQSGVNLDEEAANLLRYQQSYQAAGKMMQIASQLFDVLLQLGS